MDKIGLSHSWLVVQLLLTNVVRHKHKFKKERDNFIIFNDFDLFFSKVLKYGVNKFLDFFVFFTVFLIKIHIYCYTKRVHTVCDQLIKSFFSLLIEAASSLRRKKVTLLLLEINIWSRVLQFSPLYYFLQSIPELRV